MTAAEGLRFWRFATYGQRKGHPPASRRETGPFRRRGLSARTIAGSLTTERDTGSAQTALINAVIEKAVPALIAAREALDRFHAMMRSREEARLDPWIAIASHTKLNAFAARIEADKNAVAAAISTPCPAVRSKTRSTA